MQTFAHTILVCMCVCVRLIIIIIVTGYRRHQERQANIKTNLQSLDSRCIACHQRTFKPTYANYLLDRKRVPSLCRPCSTINTYDAVPIASFDCDSSLSHQVFFYVLNYFDACWYPLCFSKCPFHRLVNFTVHFGCNLFSHT